MNIHSYFLYLDWSRSGSSDSSPSKNDVAEAAEYFRKVDMRANRKLWAQNNCETILLLSNEICLLLLLYYA